MAVKFNSHIQKQIFKNNRQDGFSLIELLIVVVVIGIVAAIAIPNLLASRRAANEATAISALRAISSGETTFFHTRSSATYATLTDLYNDKIIDATLGTAPFTKARYLFNINLVTTTNGLPGYDATARPQNHILVSPVTGAGTRDFGVNEVGVIYQTNDNTPVTFNISTRAANGTATPIR
jgi:type IV pilus assembly protein PilA